MCPSPEIMLSRIAIASLAFGSAGFVASSVQSQFVQAVAFAGSVVPQNGHCIVSQLTICGCGGASVYSILKSIALQRHKGRFFRQAWKTTARERLPDVA